MLIKKILAALPLSPAPKRLPKQVEFCAGATVHNAGRCGDVLTVDVYNHKGELLYRFFSDGRNYITYIQRPFSAFASSGWTKRNPTCSHYYSLPDDIAANPASIAAVEEVLGRVADWRGDNSKIGCAIQMFIYRVNQERRDRARERKRALQKAHFAMFPEYPADLAAFCEDRVFQSSVLYVSKLKKTLANGQVSGERRAVCRHCGKSFQVGREVKPGGSGICPKCGHPVIYRAGWLEKEVTHKVKICIACKVDGQLLLRYVDVERIIYPDRKEPQYRFSDCFKTLFLTVNGKPTEYAYAWCQAPYCGYDWRRLRCGTECLGESYVYTPNLRDVFGPKYYNVDLQAGLAGLRRPISFRRLLDNLKNIPQAEYLMKAGLPVLAAGNLPDASAKNLPELTGLGKHFLPAMRESLASFQEIKAIAAQRNAAPEDLRQLCAQRLDGDCLILLERIARFNGIGRSLRYVRAQKEASTGRMRRNKLPYFLRLYRDYLDMAQSLKSDMSQRAILEPRDLKVRHDLLAARVNELKSRPDNERFQQAVDEGLYWWAQEYANEDYRVVYPMKRSDLTTEGQCLNHCVGGQAYFERHILGHQMVFFIRKVSAPDKPYFTAEIDTDTGRIIQLYGFGDCSAPKEVRAFTEGFCRKILRWKSMDIRREAA